MKRAVLTRRMKSGHLAAIEMTPLIDMVFILLIFYIVTTSFIREAGVTINRPESAAAEVMEDKFLPVGITKQGEVYVQGRPVDLENIRTLESALAELQTRKVVLQADRDVSTALLLQVIDFCKAGGAENVSVAALAE